jgi:transcriptional regulator with XRE-family HTH domain
MKTISDRIKYVRGDLNQEDFAKKLGVSLGAVQNWEINEKIPKGDFLIRFREEFNVDINWLLKGEGDPYLIEKNPNKTNHIQGKNPYTQDDYHEHEVSQPTQEYVTATVHQHIEIIKQFRDVEMAKMANAELLAIERTNPSAFREVVAYIKGISNGLKMAANYGGGAIEQTSDAGEEDRRSGSERREKVI